MAIELLLTTITLIVAIIGTLLRDPSRRVKAFLICLAAAASAGSAVKAVETERDKRFIQTALVSSLNPSNSAYEKLCEDIGEFAKAKGYDEEVDCPHMSDGMVALLSTSTARTGTVVFNRSEIAEMYANKIRHAGNKQTVQGIVDKSYAPSDLREEFLDKVGILGFLSFFSVAGNFPLTYHYDARFGVRLDFTNDKGQKQSILFSTAELVSFKEDKAPKLFHLLEQEFRRKFAEVKIGAQ